MTSDPGEQSEAARRDFPFRPRAQERFANRVSLSAGDRVFARSCAPVFADIDR
jgi:hypothetical protein